MSLYIFFTIFFPVINNYIKIFKIYWNFLLLQTLSLLWQVLKLICYFEIIFKGFIVLKHFKERGSNLKTIIFNK